MPCRFASSGTVATSRSASRAILALNVASNFLRDLVISVLHRLRQSRTLHTLTFGPISGVHFKRPLFGTTPIGRALIEMWNRRMELELLRPITDNFLHSSAFYKERLTQVADIAHYGRKHAQVRMHWLNGELAMGPFITVAPGRSVVPHGIDRGLDPGEMLERGDNVARPRN